MQRLIAWFAGNSVAANLLMIVMILGGTLSLFVTIRTESFPEITPENITISVAYPGATPDEIEESICVKIEEAVLTVNGVDRVVSTAAEGIGSVLVEIEDGASIRTVLEDVKSEIDAIDTFPEDAEEPTVKEQKVEERVLSMVVHGDTSERNLRVIADQLRDDLLLLPGITKVLIDGEREYEISIETREADLRRFGLRFADVARAVRTGSVNLPAGTVKTAAGEIAFRSSAQAYVPLDFARLPVLSLPDGGQLFVGDVADVKLIFEDNDLATRFDGQPALALEVYRVGHQNTPAIAARVRAFADSMRNRIPENVQLSIWRDESTNLDERLSLLRRNGFQGLLLVFLVLALFLKARLALWVSAGLIAALFGTLWVLPWLDISLNFLSSFGFILVLGILVDDAIVVSENVDSHLGMGKSPGRAAIEGTWEVMVPVSLAVITTGMAFSPMLALPGRTGEFAKTIAVVVIIAISMSLVESLLILPAHLGHEPHGARGGLLGRMGTAATRVLAPFLRIYERTQTRFADGLAWCVTRLYQPLLEVALRSRYLTLALGLAFLILTGGLLGGGWLKVSFFPPIEGNDVVCAVRLPEGTSATVTQAAVALLERTGSEVRSEVEGAETGSVIRHVRATIGDQPGKRTTGPPARRSAGQQSNANLGEVHFELVPSEERTVTASLIARRWREKVGEQIPEAEELTFVSDQINTGSPINVELSGTDTEQLQAAAAELKAYLGTIEGTFNIADDYRPGKQEIQLSLLPSGAALGLTQQDIAQQVRHGFYGDEAQRVQIGRDDVRVFVRYAKDERRSLENLEQMRIRLPDRSEVPLAQVATLTPARGPATIQRIDRQRTIVVTCDLNRSVANANEISAVLAADFLPDLSRRHPSVRNAFGGEQTRQQESFASLQSGMVLAAFMMFALLAVIFRSYLQPLIVLSAVPFGIAGAVWAHFGLGMNLTFLSMIGILALMGVVVNDSLVMIDFINRFHREHGMPLGEAVRSAGPRRFRAILLTSLTTFAGLTPMLLERSVQAEFVVPMVVSLAFGVAFATVVTLIIVPAGYLVIEDLRRVLTGHTEVDDAG
ncbi:MAG: efflux RND transporter permease subunit [Planctomycetota bacterium]